MGDTVVWFLTKKKPFIRFAHEVLNYF